MPRADLLRMRPPESRMPGNRHVRFGGGRMEQGSLPVARHCRCTTGLRTPAQADYLASRLPYDMTTTVTTGEGQVCVFVAVDHCTSECIGIHASLSGNRFEALEPLRQGVRELFGSFDAGVAAGLA